MNKVKRFLGMALAALMVVSSAAGCSNSDTASSESTGEPTFKIGGIGPVTGNTAAYGLAVQNGAQIAVDQVNAEAEEREEEAQSETDRLRRDIRELTDTVAALREEIRGLRSPDASSSVPKPPSTPPIPSGL